jgi:hypothetical protein
VTLNSLAETPGCSLLESGIILTSAREIMVQKIIALIFALFLVCFVAIVIEELFLGGRRKRKLERQVKNRRSIAEGSGAADKENP